MDFEDWHERQDYHEVSVDDTDHNIAVFRDGDGAVPTLFVHGIPTWSYLFRDVYDAASNAILPDLIGYGYTEHLGEGGYDRSIKTQEAMLRRLLDDLGHDTVQVVAHDIGGGVALRLAARTNRVERLVLSNGVCYDSWPTEFILSLANPNEARNWTRTDVNEKLETDFAEGTYDPDRATEEFVTGMKAPYLERDRPYTALSRNAIATNTNHTLDIDLDEIDCPTMLLWGNEDTEIGPEWAEKLEADLPVEESVYLDRASHWVMQDRPEAYREALAAFIE